MSYRLTASGQLERNIANSFVKLKVLGFYERLLTKTSGITKIVGKTTVYLLSGILRNINANLKRLAQVYCYAAY